MTIKPHHSWVLVRPQRRSAQVGSIILAQPIGAELTGYSTGIVVDTPLMLWAKSFEADEPTPTPFAVGDRVLYRDYLKNIHEIDVNGVSHCLLHWEDILATLSADVQVELGGVVDED